MRKKQVVCKNVMTLIMHFIQNIQILCEKKDEEINKQKKK